MDIFLILFLDVVNGVSSLFLLCFGLAIIFGMMKIINLAHGEFIMLGAYATVISANVGVNIWVAMLIVAPLFAGLVGLVIERGLIRFLCGRLVDSMLATWGLGLLIIGIVTTIFGNTIKGVSTPPSPNTICC
jgi:branched-chain amino acid transport system permease protein